MFNEKQRNYMETFFVQQTHVTESTWWWESSVEQGHFESQLEAE